MEGRGGLALHCRHQNTPHCAETWGGVQAVCEACVTAARGTASTEPSLHLCCVGTQELSQLWGQCAFFRLSVLTGGGRFDDNNWAVSSGQCTFFRHSVLTESG